MKNEHKISANKTDAAHCDAVLRDAFVPESLTTRLIARYRGDINPFAPLLAAIPPDTELLDVGCGSGLFLFHAAMRGIIRRGIGFDNNAQTVAIAEQVCARMRARHSLPPLSFAAYQNFDEWPEQQFETVALVDVLHHVPPAMQMAFLDATGRRVRDGGRIIYKDVCRRPRWRAVANHMHDLVVAKQWIHCLPIARVVEWAAQNGYTIARQDAYTKLWYGHELLVLDKSARA